MPLPLPLSAAEAPVDFSRDIRPILSANCFACHGPDERARKAKLRLDVRNDALASRDGRAAIVPNRPETSELVARITTADPDDLMPPPKTGHRLTADQISLLQRWIKEGAPYAQHWSYTPLQRSPLPEVRRAKWVRNGIDRFILARLEAEGLTPEPEADRHLLIRRVALDLTGLPPFPDDVRLFLRDRSPEAYELMVDRLLASKHFGEHWARLWLDLARYADTKGYEKDQARSMWRYRDWVIDAFNADMPYDRFTAAQLAGDLLPDSSDEDLLATAFHRNTMTNDEGGTDDEEFRILAVKDRIDTTAQVWMGLTLGCAKCHSHKYDPITIEDYYRFFAVFNQTEDADRFDEAPTVPMPNAEQRGRIAGIEAELKDLRAAFWQSSPELESAQREWERRIAGPSPWTIPATIEARSAAGATLTPQPDGSFLVSGAHADTDTFTLILSLKNQTVTAMRLEALTDPSLPKQGPGRHPDDPNFVVSELKLDWESNAGTTSLALTNSRADFSQGGWEAPKAIDGKSDTGWAISPEQGKPHLLVVDLAEPLSADEGRLAVSIVQNFPKLQLGRFRLALSAAAPATLRPEFTTVMELAAKPRDQRTPAEQKQLDEAFRLQYEITKPFHARIVDAENRLKAVQKQVAQTPVLRELPADKHRVARIHQRGNFLDPGDVVQPAILASFNPPASGAAADRLAVARWLTDPANPLTARVAVNRVWARLFGLGIVETEEDFGAQGTSPTHPELLDWLAVEFRDSLQWSMKGLCKTIVLSATYRQSARQDPAKVKRDPRNQLLSRGPRFRLPAETVRDQALAASGLLSPKTHGPSVMPPQPDGVWRAVYSGLKWETSPGEDRHRRALYTFWRRTSPYPAMTTFDAGSGEVCTIRRIRTNTPLQALVTLNDPAFIEAAGALGRRMAGGPRRSDRERISDSFRAVLIRPPERTEVSRLQQLQKTSLREFERDPAAASALLESANVKAAPDQDPADLAAWTVVGNVLLNLDETLTKP